MSGIRQAVVDIGSNAIRLVVYAGSRRAPIPIYNEKSRVSLGAGLAKDGRIDEITMQAALAAIGRLHALARAMDVDSLRVVATAATREAVNGHELVSRAANLGINIEILDGLKEAYIAGLGVLSDHPHANGYVGDLGGGSLELARICNGEIGARISLPLGTMRIGAMANETPKEIAQQLKKAIAKANPAADLPIDEGLPFFMVGGSWRALARLHIHVSDFPLAVIANYRMSPEAASELTPIAHDKIYLADTRVVPAARIETLGRATALLAGITRLLKPSELITSTAGLREGLLFDALPRSERMLDPLIEAARHEGARLARFRFHGDAIADWIAPLFDTGNVHAAKLRRAACLLADTAWNMTPEYRGDVALTLALDGSWPGVTGQDRAILAATLLAVHGNKRSPADVLGRLAPTDMLVEAGRWGTAIRLAQRLDGGTGAALPDTRLVLAGDELQLHLSGAAKSLRSESVERRLQRLAEALGNKKARLVCDIPDA
jgi:exopolyphosphatase / guanosine-5'-triphosphate,3'-diphosphate pyrophosphatase